MAGPERRRCMASILMVGASGTIGKAMPNAIGLRHHVVGAGRDSGDVRLDISDTQSI